MACRLRKRTRSIPTCWRSSSSKYIAWPVNKWRAAIGAKNRRYKGGAAPHNHSDGQDDLPRGVSAATQFQRLFGLLKGKNCLNEGPELAVVDELSDVGESPAIGFDADHCGAHTLFPGEVLQRLLRQRHEDPAFLEHSERSPLRITAHGVEHDVHVANVIFKSRRLVVDRFIAAEFSDQLDVFGAGSGANNSCAVRLCKLHRHRSDSAGRRVYQHRLPTAQFRGVKQCLVRRQRADGYGRCREEIQYSGLDCEGILVANGKLRIRAVAQQIDHAEDFIAELKTCHIHTELLDGSSQLPTQR